MPNILNSLTNQLPRKLKISCVWKLDVAPESKTMKVMWKYLKAGFFFYCPTPFDAKWILLYQSLWEHDHLAHFSFLFLVSITSFKSYLMQHNNVLVQNPIVQLLYKVELLKGAYLCITVIQSNQIQLNHFYCYLQNTSLNK